MNSNLADRLAQQHLSLPLEMLAPIIDPRIEQADQFSGHWMPSGDIRPFVPVTMQTS